MQGSVREVEAKTSIYAVRTTIGQEKGVTDLITTAVTGESDVWECPFCKEDFSSEASTLEHMKKCKKKGKKKGEPRLVSSNQLLGRVKAILVPETLRGYVFIETTEFRDVEIAISGVPHVRGRVGGKVSREEIDKFLAPPPAAEGISENDIVEIISGPFKGERAKVKRVEAGKEELTLDLLDSPHPIPIKVHADFAKIVERAVREDEGSTGAEGEEEPTDEDELGEEDSFWAHAPEDDE
ncbi:MAG: transcription elongation factor Spt5 [Candidatus Thorarchaeota archaeon]|nr:MAG: transcription elongation factor Spt5 [Candidatus Thorarchaeota archaeon]RLI58920.1 MAG: transcription elongation factor Spt5 [Candidatus Thorarchaeota archaeon]